MILWFISSSFVLFHFFSNLIANIYELHIIFHVFISSVCFMLGVLVINSAKGAHKTTTKTFFDHQSIDIFPWNLNDIDKLTKNVLFLFKLQYKEKIKNPIQSNENNNMQIDKKSMLNFGALFGIMQHSVIGFLQSLVQNMLHWIMAHILSSVVATAPNNILSDVN